MKKLKLSAVALLSTVVLAGCSIPGVTNNASDTPATVTPTVNGSANNAKSSEWPSDVPTKDNGYDYNYAKINGAYYLSYKLKLSGATLISVHNEIVASLKAAGWNGEEDNSIESDMGALHSFTKGEQQLTFTTSKDNLTDDFVSIGISVTNPE